MIPVLWPFCWNHIHLHLTLSIYAAGTYTCLWFDCDSSALSYPSIGSDKTGERKYEKDDGVTFVGSPSVVLNDEPKLNGQGLYLNTKLARKGFAREADDESDLGLQRQVAPVTVSEPRTNKEGLARGGFIVVVKDRTLTLTQR